MHSELPPMLPDFAAFAHDLQDLPGIRLDAGAFVAAQGAQLLSWRTGDGRERLYLSGTTSGMTRSGRKAAAIRGGVPVCFPQFSDRGPLIKHGFARNLAWVVAGRAANMLTLTLCDDEASRAQWPHAFTAQITVLQQAGGKGSVDSVEVRLCVTNTGDQPFVFSTALHTYLRVDDIRTTRLLGLHGTRYQDATDNCIIRTQEEVALAISGEVDRVYMAPPATLQLQEEGHAPLHITQQGFTDTVVWNPGPDKARALPDMPDHDWLHMLCVEAACAAAPVTLAPGAGWQGSQRLSLG